MNEINDLYQDIILDHNKYPHNFKILENYSHTHTCDNPLCGDSISIYLTLKENIISDISFSGSGCAISIASASMMTKYCKNKPSDEIRILFELIHNYLLGKSENNNDIPEEIQSLSGVLKFPMRVKCATMAWHCVHEIIKNEN